MYKCNTFCRFILLWYKPNQILHYIYKGKKDLDHQMISTKIDLTKENLKEIFKILKIHYHMWNGRISLGPTEKTLLSPTIIKNLAEKYCLVGTDGTTARVSNNEVESPILIGASAVIWGVENLKSDIVSYDQRFVIEGRDRLSHSSIRTILEIRFALCVLLARKFKTLNCSNCPFNKSGCQLQGDSYKPWEVFPDKIAVAILDLPVIFTFIKSIPTLSNEIRKYLLDNLKLIFDDIKKYKLPVIFVSHKSKLRAVSQNLASELDEAINSVDNRAKEIINLISEKEELKNIKLPFLAELSKNLKDKFFTDFDLLEAWIDDIAIPSPIFEVKPDDYNNFWNELKFHYFTWGYKELIEGEWIYISSSWIRIGYSPALTSELAHQIICLEMILGKSHSISLTMAHTCCNMYKEELLSIILAFYNKNKPDKHKLGRNVKDITKWRLMRIGRK